MKNDSPNRNSPIFVVWQDLDRRTNRDDRYLSENFRRYPRTVTRQCLKKCESEDLCQVTGVRSSAGTGKTLQIAEID